MRADPAIHDLSSSEEDTTVARVCARGASRFSAGMTTYPCYTAMSPDWIRFTPALAMSAQALASEPWVSMPRQASSMT